MPSALTRAKARLAARRKALTAAKAAVKKAAAKVAESARTVKRLSAAQQTPGPWMPGALRDPQPSIGPCTVGNKAGLLHTTEGLNFDAMDSVLKAKRACPTFLVGLKNGRAVIKQYRPVWDAGTALENPPGGVETNRKMLVQIEVCAFANNPKWPNELRDAVASVMAWSHRHGVPLTCSVKFTDSRHVVRLSGPDWVRYTGWLGHQHCPEQPTGHWDPGAIDIADLLVRAKG